MARALKRLNSISSVGLMVFFLHALPFSPSFGSDLLSVTNIHFEVAGEDVVIYYDLIGSVPQENQNVTLTLRRESDPSFQYMPTMVTGDVGLGRFVGSKRRIVWDRVREFPQGLGGSDYYFVIGVESILRRPSRGFLWKIGAGAAAVGGTTFALIALSRKTSQAGFPHPPGRP